MKIKKVLMIGMAITATLALAACGQTGKGAAEGTTQKADIESTSPSDTGETVDENWYKKVLEDESIKKEYSYYSLQDINLDGTDELFLSTTAKDFIGFEDKACLMANVNGEAKTLQEIGGAGGEYWICHQSDATLTYYSRLSGEEHIILYKLENGELKEISTADTYDPHHYTEKDNDKTLYFIDKKEVSKEEAESYWEQYGNEAGAITYDLIEDVSID